MGGVMPRNLTSRQKKFIAAIAAGKTQTAAYKEAGYAANGKPRTTVRSARRLAQHAEVRAAIEEMQVQLLPDPGDVREIRAHAMGVIVRLSLEAEEEKVRLAAAQWLHEETGKQIAERERLKAEPPREESAEEVIVQFANYAPRCWGNRCRWWKRLVTGRSPKRRRGCSAAGSHPANLPTKKPRGLHHQQKARKAVEERQPQHPRRLLCSA